MELFEAVRHLDPIILTGLPRGNWAAPQKVRWAAEHFPDTRIITCLAADKRRHAREGDILVDDTLKYRDLWTGLAASSSTTGMRGLRSSRCEKSFRWHEHVRFGPLISPSGATPHRRSRPAYR
jgi:hypothetical protein